MGLIGKFGMRIGQALTGSIAIAALATASCEATAARDAILVGLGQRLFPTIVQMSTQRAPPPLSAVLTRRQRRVEACGQANDCRLKALEWSDTEMAAVETAAAKQMNGPMDETRAAIRRELVGLNAILRVYGSGEPPRYPDIDGPDGVGTPLFEADVAAAFASADAIRNEPVVRLDQSVALALTLLDGANRLDAIAFEPLDRENTLPAARAAKLDWSSYPYTAIILLGVGPEVSGVSLSPMSKLNVHLAAERYRAGVAPFIIVSGAGVHPRRTTYVEAIEMRRALIERYSIPADAIVIEPYARHTTTNLRNAARLLIGLKAPENRPALIVTNREHGASISSEAFAKRNVTELGYTPGHIAPGLSPFDFPFFYDRKSLRVDPSDPLDP